MKQKKSVIAYLLALIMVVTSVSIPSVPVQADEGVEVMSIDPRGVYQLGDYSSFDEDGIVHYDSLELMKESGTPTVEEYLYQQLKAKAASIDISEYNIPYDVTTFSKLFNGVINDHPDLYAVNVTGSSVHGKDGYVTTIDAGYDSGYDDAKFNDAVAAALAVVDEDMTALQKAIVLHDYLAVNCEYDQVNYNTNSVPDVSHTAYGALVNNIAVCDGYALAYKYLLNGVGIDCYMVRSEDMKHAWNMINLDGQLYQVDVTWADPSPWDIAGRARHTYMFCSDTEFEASYNNHDSHTGGVVTVGSKAVDYKATSTLYDNAFWKESNSPLVISGGDCYYVAPCETEGGYLSKKPTIKKKSLEDGDINLAGEELLEIEYWTNKDGSKHYGSAYTGLFKIDGRLYFNDKEKIYSIDPGLEGFDKKEEYAPDTSLNYIYGSALRKNEIIYSFSSSPEFSSRVAPLVAITDIGDPIPSFVELSDLTLDQSTLSLDARKTGSLKASLTPTNATYHFVTWTSSDPAVATVDSVGKVTAAAAGTCTITAKAGDKAATCTVTVTAGGGTPVVPVESVELDVVGISLKVGGTRTLEATVSPDNATNKTVTWSSTDTSVATVDNNGKVTAEAAGTCNIIATAGGKTVKCTVTVTGNATPKPDATAKPDVTPAPTPVPTEAPTPAPTETPKPAAEESETETPYAIKYYLNGGTAPASNPAKYGGKKNYKLAEPTRTGYSFKGWRKDSADGELVSQISVGMSGDLELYADWSPISYNVAFDGNGATGNMTAMNACDYDRKYPLTENSFQREGYAFAGWNTKADGSGKKYANMANIINLTEEAGGTVTLYAQWVQGAYAITYYLMRDNQEDAENDPSNPDYYTSGSAVTFAKPTMRGYIFKGWYKDDKFKKKITGIKAADTGEIAVYAKWTAGKYNIKFNKNGGKGSMSSMKNRVYGKEYTLTKNKFTKKGYTFVEWNTEADGSGLSFENKETVKNLEDCGKTFTLYAQWEKAEYTITYDCKGGEFEEGEAPDGYPEVYSVDTATISLTGLPAPVKDGYTFQYWCSDSKCKKKLMSIKTGSTGNKKLYAKWKKG